MSINISSSSCALLLSHIYHYPNIVFHPSPFKQRFSSEHGFGGDRERASEEGKKGGSKNSTDDNDE